MAVVLQGVPPKFDWGWFSREDPRMHVQTVDDEHREGKEAYKVWLEENGRRVFVPDGPIPAKVLKPLKVEVQRRRLAVEAQWASFMVKQGWLQLALDPSGKVATLTAYGHYPGKFTRTVDLVDHFPIIAGAPLSPSDIKLVTNPSAIELWGEDHISLAELLWTGPNP